MRKLCLFLKIPSAHSTDCVPVLIILSVLNWWILNALCDSCHYTLISMKTCVAILSRSVAFGIIHLWVPVRVPSIKDVRSRGGGVLSSAGILRTGEEVLQMRTSKIFGAKKSGFFEINGVSAWNKEGLSQCGQGERGSIFRDFVRKSYGQPLIQINHSPDQAAWFLGKFRSWVATVCRHRTRILISSCFKTKSFFYVIDG